MAISLSRSQVAYRVFAMAAPGLDEETAGIFIADIEDMIDEAVKMLCDQVLMSKQYERLHTTFSVSAGGDGSADLPDAVITETVKPEKGGRVTSTSLKYPLCYKKN